MINNMLGLADEAANDGLAMTPAKSEVYSNQDFVMISILQNG